MENNQNVSKEIFVDNWYKNKDEFIKNYRKMSLSQLKNFYKKSDSNIGYTIRKFSINKDDFLEDLKEEELLFMYDSLLNNAINTFTKGLFKCSSSRNYFIILLKYLVNNILKWNREDICKKYCSDILKKYKLAGASVCTDIGAFEILRLSFPLYDIKPWELINSSCDWNEENIKEIKPWIKNVLKKDYNINNIKEAGTHSFKKLCNDYRLLGLANSKFNHSPIELFEYIYGEKFNKEEMLKINFNFEINTVNIKRTLEGIIYSVTKEYDTLDERGLTLINQIIRFCEENNKFPKEKDLTIKNGFIPHRQFNKYFNCNNFSDVYKYIIPVDNGTKGGSKLRLATTKTISPKSVVCLKCNIEKPYTKEYFCSGKRNKYGLKYECLECSAKESVQKHYMEMGIKYESIEDISSEQWYEFYLLNDNMRYMPEHCYLENNLIKIIRYIIMKKANLVLKEDIIKNFNKNLFAKYKINTIIYKLGGNLLALQKCFPKLCINEEDINKDKYTNEYMCEIIDNVLELNNYSIMDILNGKFDGKNSKQEFKNYRAMLSVKFYTKDKDMLDMFIWYFDYKNILHPIYNRNIKKFDFKYISKGFWNDKENVYESFKSYCEEKCTISILEVINNNEDLFNWVVNNLKYNKVLRLMNSYKNFYTSTYKLLIDAYPQLQENKFIKANWNKIAYDGTVCNSYEEVKVYEFIKVDLHLKYIQSIGMSRKGKYIYKLKDNKNGFTTFIPDFVIEKTIYNNKTVNFKKAIIIEYFGLNGKSNTKNSKFKDYDLKTKEKIEFYKSNDEIYFLDLYPEDLKNNFQGLKAKLESFFMSNFNIEINNDFVTENGLMNIINNEEEDIAI